MQGLYVMSGERLSRGTTAWSADCPVHILACKTWGAMFEVRPKGYGSLESMMTGRSSVTNPNRLDILCCTNDIDV
jgi:hypothetical protein